MAGILPDKSTRAGDIITKTTGLHMYLYYQYVAKFNVRPVSLDELISGLLFIKAEASIKELYDER